MVAQKPVNVTFQMLSIFILFLWVYAFYRIEKLRIGIVLVLIATGCSIGTQMLLPFPYNLVAYAFYIIFPVYHIRKYSIEWNSKF